MNYPEELFRRFDGDHQLRIVYKLAQRIEGDRAGTASVKMEDYLNWCENSELRKFIGGEWTPAKNDGLLAFLEGRFSTSVRDDQIPLREGDGKIRSSAEKAPLRIVLHNLRSAFNVGAIFRTAECLALQEILLTGYTPAPDQRPVAKTSMGTGERVHWRKADLDEAIETCRADGPVIAFETVDESRSLYESELPDRGTFLFGNERFGLPVEILKKADHILQIPVYGWKNSLNVATACAVAAYEWRRQRLARGLS